MQIRITKGGGECMIVTRYLHVTISIYSRIRAKLGLKPLEVGNEKKQHTGMLMLCLG